MNREEAIAYLDRKGRLVSEKYNPVEEIEEKTEEELQAEDEKEIKEVMKRGKIYGDPVAQLY